MDMRSAAFTKEYLRQREALLEAYPELAEDMEALSDTLEGVTYAPELIAGFIRDAREDDAMADALGSMIKDMQERKQRLGNRADKRRSAAMAIMQAIGLTKLEQPDFTASIRRVPPKVEITDETAIPDFYIKVVRSPDKTLLKEALAKGPVPGAALSNGGETIALRFK